VDYSAQIDAWYREYYIIVLVT